MVTPEWGSGGWLGSRPCWGLWGVRTWTVRKAGLGFSVAHLPPRGPMPTSEEQDSGFSWPAVQTPAPSLSCVALGRLPTCLSHFICRMGTHSEH